MLALGILNQEQRNLADAAAAFQQVLASHHDATAPLAAFALGTVLE